MDRSEFERRVAASRNRIIVRALKRLDRDDAEDAVQTAMLVALNKPDWHEIVNVNSWMLGIVDNAVSNFIRVDERANRPREMEPEADAFDIVDAMANDEEIAQRVGVIMEAAGRAGLTSREDYIFLARLRDVEYADIARTLGTDAASVRASYSWALRKIRAVVGDGVGDAAIK